MYVGCLFTFQTINTDPSAHAFLSQGYLPIDELLRKSKIPEEEDRLGIQHNGGPPIEGQLLCTEPDTEKILSPKRFTPLPSLMPASPPSCSLLPSGLSDSNFLSTTAGGSHTNAAFTSHTALDGDDEAGTKNLMPEHTSRIAKDAARRVRFVDASGATSSVDKLTDANVDEGSLEGVKNLKARHDTDQSDKSSPSHPRQLTSPHNRMQHAVPSATPRFGQGTFIRLPSTTATSGGSGSGGGNGRGAYRHHGGAAASFLENAIRYAPRSTRSCDNDGEEDSTSNLRTKRPCHRSGEAGNAWITGMVSPSAALHDASYRSNTRNAHCIAVSSVSLETFAPASGSFQQAIDAAMDVLREPCMNARLAHYWSHGNAWARLDVHGVELLLADHDGDGYAMHFEGCMAMIAEQYGGDVLHEALSRLETEWQHLKMLRQKYVAISIGQDGLGAVPETKRTVPKSILKHASGIAATITTMSGETKPSGFEHEDGAYVPWKDNKINENKDSNDDHINNAHEREEAQADEEAVEQEQEGKALVATEAHTPVLAVEIPSNVTDMNSTDQECVPIDLTNPGLHVRSRGIKMLRASVQPQATTTAAALPAPSGGEHRLTTPISTTAGLLVPSSGARPSRQLHHVSEYDAGRHIIHNSAGRSNSKPRNVRSRGQRLLEALQSAASAPPTQQQSSITVLPYSDPEQCYVADEDSRDMGVKSISTTVIDQLPPLF